jgi:diadenosine tetraphosphatase ApaH/serine/threonine PP2A family protein phosphatase
MVHGAFRDEDEYVFAPAQALDSLLDPPAQITFFGHTHLQGGFTLHDDQVAVLHFKPVGGQQFAALTVEDGTTYLLNPGSIGQPRDGDTRAAFVIADLPKKSIEFWRVPYDIEAVQKRMGAGGLPEPLIQRLAFGR